MEKALKLTFLLLLAPLMTFGQKGVEDGSKYGHGKDSIRCLENLSISHEYVKHDNFKDAWKPWRVTYMECPRASKNIYIDGVKIFKYLIEEEKDPQVQSQLVDTLMMIYDQRMKYYGQRGNVLSRKAIDLLRYKRDNIEDIEKGYNYLEESVNLRKTKSSAAALATYFTAALTLYRYDRLPGDKIVEIYLNLMGIIEQILEKKPNNQYMVQVRDIVEQNFTQSGVPDCPTLVEIFGSKFEKYPGDVDLLKKITSLLDENECTDQVLFEEASEKLYKIEPSPSAAYNLAKLFIKKDNLDKAESYFKEALASETDTEKLAVYNFELAALKSKLGSKQEARKYALAAIENKPNWGDPYILIGNLYAGSSNTCGENDFEKKTVFWSAVDMYAKAKKMDPSVESTANDLIARYSQYFPNNEEAFFYGLSNGDPYTVECWINDRTTVRTIKK
jgi:tetratricopeptide (TPR) repeat protein